MQGFFFVINQCVSFFFCCIDFVMVTPDRPTKHYSGIFDPRKQIILKAEDSKKK